MNIEKNSVTLRTREMKKQYKLGGSAAIWLENKKNMLAMVTDEIFYDSYNGECTT